MLNTFTFWTFFKCNEFWCKYKYHKYKCRWKDLQIVFSFTMWIDDMMCLFVLVGARGWRPLWRPPWVPVTFGHCFLFLKIFYSLFFTALDALPCPAPALFRIFLLLPGTGGGSYTLPFKTDRQTCCLYI